MLITNNYTQKESIICLTVVRIDNYVSGNRLKIKSGLEW